MQKWQLQEAKARLSDVVRSATTDGPQEITVRGETAVVVISQADYQRLIRQKTNLVEFLRKSPLSGVDLDLERNRSKTRRVEL